MTDGLHRGEAETVARTRDRPATVDSLIRDLRALGVRNGATMLVHSSLRALGWVVGGSEAVVLALESAVGPTGTIMMPAYSMNAPEPSAWKDPPVPAAWWETVRNEWPAFDPELSPSLRLGVIPETFRAQRGTARSFHPNNSFCARGPNARRLLEGHRLESSLGEPSPLARLYELDGEILLLGIDHGSNSSLHLAEYRTEWPGKPPARRFSGRVVRSGRSERIEYLDLDLNSDDFAELGEAMERETRVVRTGPVGAGTGRRMSQRAAVDFAVGWLARHRRSGGGATAQRSARPAGRRGAAAAQCGAPAPSRSPRWR